MIVPMKKIFLIVQNKDAASALEELRGLGTVHVEHQKLPEGQEIVTLKEEVQKLVTLVDYFQKCSPQGQQEREAAEEKVDTLTYRLSQLTHIKDEMAKRQTLIHFWQPWGDFDLQDVQILRSRGLSVKLYRIPEAELEHLPEGVVCETVFVHEKIAHCIVISQEEPSLSFPEIAWPTISLGDMMRLQEADARKILALEKELKENSVYLNAFKDRLEKKNSDLRLQEALAGMGESQGLFYLKGFCPSENFAKIQHLARTQKWGLVMEEPSDEDKVPTLIKNPKWVELIKPVFAIMNILPGYKELDISIFFLLFLSLFFGMLIGDAGYGIVILLAIVFFHLKNNDTLEDKKLLSLMYVFSMCAIVWGVLTGVFFGQSLIPSFKPWLPWLNDTRNMQMLCFFIGATHLSIAHAWRALIKMPSTTALADVGWIVILWFMFFLAKALILNEIMSPLIMYLLYAGCFLVIFFNQKTSNIFKTIGVGLGTLLMSIVNMFTDVVSYIRLAAVGLASVAVADAFNQMVMGIGFKTIFSGVAAILVLFVGHALNLTLGFMAIMVHGIRLNILEFSSHLSMEWSGVAYDPLSKTKNIKI